MPCLSRLDDEIQAAYSYNYSFLKIALLQVKDLQLEMEEMHDQFREEETAEIRELQRELETTAKACRIVNFKLRKAERRCDQLEAEKVQAEEKSRQLETRFRTSDDRHLLELEEELRVAKVSLITI